MYFALFNNCIIENGIIRYDFTPQTVAAAGVLECEIRIYDEDGGVLHLGEGFLVEHVAGGLHQRAMDRDVVAALQQLVQRNQRHISTKAGGEDAKILHIRILFLDPAGNGQQGIHAAV